MKNIAVFASGGGSDFQSVVDGVESGLIDGKIVLLVASRKGIGALERAKKHGIDSAVFDKKKFASDEEMFSAIGDELVRRGTELIVLAGYLNILPPRFVERFAKKIINIHPSLIPKYCGDGFYGMRVHRAVVENGERESGCTVHYVDEGTDTGEIIAQARVKLDADDTAESVAAKVLEKEHELLPRVVAALCKNQ
mgnify:FL=1